MTLYAYPHALIETQALAERLGNANLRLVEVDLTPQRHLGAHLPGAVFWQIIPDLLQRDLSLNLERSALEALLARSGISNQTTVVAYGSDPGTSAWIFWLLKLFGHADVRVLNGGHQKWVAEGRPVSAELSTVAPAVYRAKPLDAALRIGPDRVLENLQLPQQVLLDVRTAAEYSGDQFLLQPPTAGERAGHIPGSIHIEHLQAFNPDGTFKSFDQLQALYRSHGVLPEHSVVPYCAIGGRSACIWFVLKYLLGYPDVRNYDGSWNQWSRLPGSPVATG